MGENQWMRDVLKEAVALSQRRPDLKNKINCAFSLMLAEVEDGGSMENEVSLLRNAMKEMEEDESED